MKTEDVKDNQESDIDKNITQKKKRKKGLLLLVILIILCGIAYYFYYQFYAKYYETTDNAYVNGNLVILSPQVAGTVSEIYADDGDFVRKGEAIVRLDGSETLIQRESAEASLASVVRQVRGLYSTSDNYKAQAEAKEVAYRQALNDYNRRKNLLGSGAISREDLTHYQETLETRRKELDSAREALKTNLAMTDGTIMAQHPEIKSAIANFKQKYLDHARAVLIAPVSGYVAKRGVQLGSRVDAGSNLLSIVPLNAVWVDANFKENQMSHMKIGQKVVLTSDLYGDDVKYSGTIESLGIGTGSAFALLPAQNASGNWIKIVQRLPVKIKLEPQHLDAHPLRVGLSMEARVDLHEASGPLLATAVNETPRYTTDVYDNALKEADKIVDEILHSNGISRPNIQQ
ncbi:HlyD family secretion protein [Brenneria tiliae]|nr:HlyD family efflux transporter periplasmic adaptor subunit [Brenneria tiliae]MCL2898414.1 HlyD family efflux transporter periplasmic adaptor subunit [Brenneria tiliae]MCL2903044.1 HlyD family efflux transporter periplasmic adaptor subunit [Brenneria tiliae]